MTYLLLGTSSRVALPVMQAIYAAGGARPILVGPEAVSMLRWSWLCRSHVRVDLDNDDELLGALGSLATRWPDSRVVPFDCAGARAVNRLRSRLALQILPIPDTATLDVFDDKWRFHEFCSSNGLPVPRTRFVGPRSKLDFSTLAAELGVPFVVKPTNRSGSDGVEVVHDARQLQHEVIDNPRYPDAPLLAQQFISGEDMDINLLARRGVLAACSVHRVSGPWMEFVCHPQLQAIADRICRESGYNGVMNVDVRLESGTGNLYLLEANPRFWATLAAAVGCGLNFVSESARPEPPLETPRYLGAGRFNMRHPLLRPSSWPGLAARDEPARLLRAQMFDPYVLGQLADDLPAMAARRLHRWRDRLRPRAARATLEPVNAHAGLGSEEA